MAECSNIPGLGIRCPKPPGSGRFKGERRRIKLPKISFRRKDGGEPGDGGGGGGDTIPKPKIPKIDIPRFPPPSLTPPKMTRKKYEYVPEYQTDTIRASTPPTSKPGVNEKPKTVVKRPIPSKGVKKVSTPSKAVPKKTQSKPVSKPGTSDAGAEAYVTKRRLVRMVRKEVQ